MAEIKINNDRRNMIDAMTSDLVSKDVLVVENSVAFLDQGVSFHWYEFVTSVLVTRVIRDAKGFKDFYLNILKFKDPCIDKSEKTHPVDYLYKVYLKGKESKVPFRNNKICDE